MIKELAAQIIEMLQEKSEEEKLQIIAIILKKGIYEGLYIGDAFWGNLHINMDCDRDDISFVVTQEMIEAVKSIPIEKEVSVKEWNESSNNSQKELYLKMVSESSIPNKRVLLARINGHEVSYKFRK